MKSRTAKQILHQGKHIRLVRRGRWEYAERLRISGIVILVPVTDENRIVLVEQYRVPAGGCVLELPAGLVGDVPGRHRESLVTAAKRELIEETGYSARHMRFLTEGPPSVGISGEHVSFFLATGLRKVGPGGGDASEDIRVHEVPLRRVDAWLASRRRMGLIVDPKVYTGLYFLLKH